jgi:hypothetical protein
VSEARERAERRRVADELERRTDHAKRLLDEMERQQRQEAEHQGHAEARGLLAAALERNPPQIGVPGSPGVPGAPRSPREGRESVAGGVERAEPHPAGREAQEPSEALGGSGSFAGSGTARGSWWRRMVGG